VAIKPCSVGTQLQTSTLIKVALLIHNLSTFAIFPLTGEDAKVANPSLRQSAWRHFVTVDVDRHLGRVPPLCG